jgi:hypothetical protein
LVRAARVATELAFELDQNENTELAFYAARQVRKAAEDLKEKWYALHEATET